jgi:formate dehydrogenase iron-sulfur subunit
MIEVGIGDTRVAYGPVAARDLAGLFDAGFLQGGGHPLAHGPTAQIPWLARQQRLTCARVGIIDPVDAADYERYEGFAGLRHAIGMSPQEIVREVADSGLRGRGGAAFPTGTKWRTVLEQVAPQKFIACNADEGDSGTFADRMLMEGDPLSLRGMTIAGFAVGATACPPARRMPSPTSRSRGDNRGAYGRLLGSNILAADDGLEVHVGAGAYICRGDLMRASLEDDAAGACARRCGGQDSLDATVVNNVVSLATVPVILARGAAFYRDYGVGQSRGTLPVQLAGNLRRGGLVELAFGPSLRELLYDFGGGSASGRPLRAVQVGGPLGAYLPESQFDTALDYEALAGIGALLGHGGVVAFDDTGDMARMARFAMQFCAHESCGKCTPCRILDTRRGAHRPDHSRPGPRAQPGHARGLV